MSDKVDVKDFLKALKGPETKEEAIELLKKDNNSRAGIEQSAALSAVILLLVTKGVCTAEEFKEAKELYMNNLYDKTAEELLKLYKREDN